jgi:hypothetical protein
MLISLCRSFYHPQKTVENTAYFSHISMNTSNATLQHCFVFMLVYHASPAHLWRDSGEPRIKPLMKALYECYPAHIKILLKPNVTFLSPCSVSRKVLGTGKVKFFKSHVFILI